MNEPLGTRCRAAAVLSLVLVAASVEADSGGCTHRVIVAPPTELQARLGEAADEGFHVAAVARPDGTAPAAPPIVVVARAASSATTKVGVVTSPTLEGLQDQVDESTAHGYWLRGLTRGQDQREATTWVAVLEKPRSATVSAAPAYRLLRSRGDKAEWRRLEQAARDGFSVVDVLWWPVPDRSALSDVLWWPVPDRSALSDVVFVAEQPAGAAIPREVELVWEPVDKLEAKLAAFGAIGYAANVAWTSQSYVNVLMSRPLAHSGTAAGRLEVDEDPGLPAVSSMSGRLVAWLAWRSGQVAIYDRGANSEGYALEWGSLETRRWQPTPAPGALELAAHLDDRGREGLCAFDAVWHQLADRPPELLVLLRREEHDGRPRS